jgi:hypothetical protein
LYVVDAGHELGRDVTERQPRELVRVVKLSRPLNSTAHLRQAADRRRRKVRPEKCVVSPDAAKARDGDAGDALQRFGDRLVGEAPMSVAVMEIDHRVRFFLISCAVCSA